MVGESHRGVVQGGTKMVAEGEDDFHWGEGVEGDPLMDERQRCLTKADQHHHGD